MSCLDGEALACRLCLAYDADNADAYMWPLAEFMDCPGCAADVVVVLTRMLVSLLDRQRGDWRRHMMARLITMLDTMAEMMR